MVIKVLGMGCANCIRLKKDVEQAVRLLGIEAQIVEVKEIQAIMAYRVMSTPALVINEQVKSAGRIPSQAELVSFIQTAQAQA